MEGRSSETGVADYERVLEELNVEPSKIVFLDDLGENLKPARAMGITTVKVASIDVAMRELADLLSLVF